jgi:anti-sigma factor RsiW
VIRCDDARPLLGSHVLGGLDANEAAIAERHLRTCAECRQIHARLATLPPLLDMAEPDLSIDTAPSPLLESSVLAGFAARERDGASGSRRGRRRIARPARWQVAIASALAGGAAAIGVLALAGAFSSSGDATETGITLRPPTGSGAASAHARLVSTSAGTDVALEADLPRLRGAQLYELWFARGDGAVSAGTFTVDAHGRAHLRMTSAARARDYDRIGITREPDGADPARNGPSVVVGALRG